MYGSSSKEELVEKKLSKSISSFYDTKQRIENYIDGEYLQEHKSKEKGSGKKYRFMYDPFICPVNITVRQSRQSGVARATCPD